MSAPVAYTQHALDRFLERWLPNLSRTSQELKFAKSAFQRIVSVNATHVENVPGEGQSIWAFYMQYGPYQGYAGLLVVDRDGLVRTTLPPGTRKGS